MTRTRLVLILPLLAGDCALNWMLNGSFHKTLSAEAWRHRTHDWWGWLHEAIDAFFLLAFRQTEHCKKQAITETQHGSVWTAWANSWRQS